MDSLRFPARLNAGVLSSLPYLFHTWQRADNVDPGSARLVSTLRTCFGMFSELPQLLIRLEGLHYYIIRCCMWFGFWLVKICGGFSFIVTYKEYFSSGVYSKALNNEGLTIDIMET
jgi:hypothetical protein